MRHFTKISAGIDVAPVLAELDAQPELWNAHGFRKTGPGTPHGEMTDIWIRYRTLAELTDHASYKAPHIPVWYPAWAALPSLRPIIFGLMAQVQGEMLGGVLITKIPPGHGIAWHTDDGWHVDRYDKFYLSLRSAPGSIFGCDDGAWQESIEPEPGDVYLFDNRKRHYVENRSAIDRITLIACIRTEMFGREAGS